MQHDAAELADLQPDLLGDGGDVAAQALDVLEVARDQVGPAAVLEPRHPLDPVVVELVAHIVGKEALARDAGRGGEPEQLALETLQVLVQVEQLLHQRLDPALVQRHLLHQLDHAGAGRLIFAVEFDRHLAPRLDQGEPLLLQLAQAAIGLGDGVEGLEHAVAQLVLERGQRQRVLVEVLFLEDLRHRRGALVLLVGTGLPILVGFAIGGGRRWLGLGHHRDGGLNRHRTRFHHGDGHRGDRWSRHCRLGPRTGIVGGLEVDDVAQEHAALADRVAPADHGPHG